MQVDMQQPIMQHAADALQALHAVHAVLPTTLATHASSAVDGLWGWAVGHIAALHKSSGVHDESTHAAWNNDNDNDNSNKSHNNNNNLANRHMAAGATPGTTAATAIVVDDVCMIEFPLLLTMLTAAAPAVAHWAPASLTGALHNHLAQQLLHCAGQWTHGQQHERERVWSNAVALLTVCFEHAAAMGWVPTPEVCVYVFVVHVHVYMHGCACACAQQHYVVQQSVHLPTCGQQNTTQLPPSSPAGCICMSHTAHQPQHTLQCDAHCTPLDQSATTTQGRGPGYTPQRDPPRLTHASTAAACGGWEITTTRGLWWSEW